MNGLHVQHDCDNTKTTGMSEDVYPQEWETKIAFMRERGITSAKWFTVQVYDPELKYSKHVETITECTLGPAPQAPEAVDETQPSIVSPQTAERRAREERRRVASAASGGPVRRLDERD